MYSFSNFCFLDSVLAAASTVFASFFKENPLVEEDLQVILVGYDYEILKLVVEYVYTGVLEFAISDKVSPN